MAFPQHKDADADTIITENIKAETKHVSYLPIILQDI